MIFANESYGLELAAGGRRLDLASASGTTLATLSLLSALDRADGGDETLAVAPPEARGGTIVVERRSTLWDRAWVELACLQTCVEVRTCVRGRGALTDVRLLGGRSLELDYDGHTRVEDEFKAPAVLITPNVPDPYTGLRRHRDDLVARGFAPPPEPRERPAWWTEPIFCGWGAQCYLERVSGGLARDFATQEHYDAFLRRRTSFRR